MTKSLTSYDYSYVSEIIEREGEWLHGGEEIAVVTARWLRTGLSIQLIEQYIAAKTFEPQAALEMHQDGITPTMAEEIIEVGGQLDTRGYWVSNGDI